MEVITKNQERNKDQSKVSASGVSALDFLPPAKKCNDWEFIFSIDIPAKPEDLIAKYNTETVAFCVAYTIKIKIKKDFYDWITGLKVKPTKQEVAAKMQTLFDNFKSDYKFRAKESGISPQAKVEGVVDKTEDRDALLAIQKMIQAKLAKL